MSGSATMQAKLWGERAGDWAELLENAERPWLGPAYELVLDRLAVGPETDVLDVGCGSGRFCVLAAARGARVAGIDATPELLAIARERNPEAELRLGDMQFLPWPERSFDLVTGFNAFFYAADIVAAFAEAVRVLRPGGHVALTAFGRPERCESSRALEYLAPMLPEFAVEDDELPLEPAGLTAVDAGYLEIAEEYPDLETLLRAWLSIGPVRLAVRNAGEEAVREALSAAFAPLRTSGGGYRVEDEYRYVVAQAATG